MEDKTYGKKIVGKSHTQTVTEILDPNNNPNSIHPSRIEDHNRDNAIRYLATQLDTLFSIVKCV